MIKRTLYFGKPVYLSTSKKQLVANFKEHGIQTIPIEDIAYIIIDHVEISLSHTLISKLLNHNVALITTNEQHHPQGMMLNLDSHTVQHERSQAQLNASVPLKKQLWQQTIQAKVENQGRVLQTLGIDAGLFFTLSKDVKSGDSTNIEAQAANAYWKLLFNAFYSDFRRGRHEIPPNNALNYGYAILRAIVARALVGSGLFPLFGIHHHNRYNAYPLADDIMEPYRPYVDSCVYELIDIGYDLTVLTPDIKKELLTLPTMDVSINRKKRPLMIAVQTTTNSLAECFKKVRKKIKYPVFEASEIQELPRF